MGKKLRKKLSSWFTKIGVFFSAAVITIGLFVFVWWLVVLIRDAIEAAIQRNLVEQIRSLGQEEETPAIRTTDSLVSASFSDLFSGTAWLDTSATTMYRDHNATAFTFPPAFELRPIEPISPIGPIGPIGQIGLIGRVIKSGDVYKGLVYRADGTPVFDEENTPFVSQYKGELGFGGDENNWLAVYGAYEGQAFQFRDNERRDVSHLFGIRVMNGGFTPVIVHNKEAAAWYVFSNGEKNVKFLKLFEDGDGWIGGVTDLTESAKIVEMAGSSDGKIWLKVETTGGATTWYEFIDKGFFDGRGSVVVSGNLNTRNAEVREARISRVDLASNGAEVRFFLANKPGEWQPAAVGGEVVFSDLSGRGLYWRAEFSPANNRLISPFFDFINIEYWLKF